MHLMELQLPSEKQNLPTGQGLVKLQGAHLIPTQIGAVDEHAGSQVGSQFPVVKLQIGLGVVQSSD